MRGWERPGGPGGVGWGVEGGVGVQEATYLAAGTAVQRHLAPSHMGVRGAAATVHPLPHPSPGTLASLTLVAADTTFPQLCHVSW